MYYRCHSLKLSCAGCTTPPHTNKKTEHIRARAHTHTLRTARQEQSKKSG